VTTDRLDVQVVILAAGMGTRLGRPFPKPLTPLRDGRSILSQQLGNVRDGLGPDSEVLVVVGFKLEQILEAAPHVAFAYNELYDQTNTSKSLLKALRVTGSRGVLWMNGDVVFHPDVLRRVAPLVAADRSFVCVNTAVVGDEEVKYTVDGEGRIAELSKTVEGGLGEAVGINFVAAKDKATLVRRLAEVEDQDYFERGIEVAIAQDGLEVVPVDISDLFAIEVDFEGDLARANEYV
jgi:choline kinase